MFLGPGISLELVNGAMFEMRTNSSPRLYVHVGVLLTSSPHSFGRRRGNYLETPGQKKEKKGFPPGKTDRCLQSS